MNGKELKEMKSENEILKKFNYRCIRCGRKTLVIHEISPRILGKDSMREENRVPLCNKCHDWAHSLGSIKSGIVLRKLRDRKLSLWQKK
jgi:5-methylcytosine-specific restriction endonuclease McrA